MQRVNSRETGKGMVCTVCSIFRHVCNDCILKHEAQLKRRKKAGTASCGAHRPAHACSRQPGSEQPRTGPPPARAPSHGDARTGCAGASPARKRRPAHARFVRSFPEHLSCPAREGHPNLGGSWGEEEGKEVPSRSPGPGLGGRVYALNAAALGGHSPGRRWSRLHCTQGSPALG